MINFIFGRGARKRINFKELICYGKIPKEFKKDLSDLKITEIRTWQDKKRGII